MQSKRIKLYHISPEIDKLEIKFTPRIPVDIENNEDNTTLRICFSDSIEGCLSAMGNVNRYIDETGKGTFVMYSFECFIDDNNLIDWRSLFESGKVPDAAVTHEYWYMKPITLHGRRIIINNLEYAHQNRRTVKVIQNKYRENILTVLKRYGLNEDMNHYDICYLINNYILQFSCKRVDAIQKDIAKAITIHGNDEEEGEIYEKVYGVIAEHESYVDWYELGIYEDLDITVI